MWPSCFHLVPLYLKGNSVQLILSVVARFYSVYRALSKGREWIHILLFYIHPFRSSSPRAFLRWVTEECSHTLNAGCCLWQQDKSWMDSLHGCGPALMPWKGKSSLWGWGEGALLSRAVFQTRCPAVQIKKILIKLKLFETKIQPLQKPLISYGFLCIFLSLLNFSF